jgi:hypothetical protein
MWFGRAAEEGAGLVPVPSGKTYRVQSPPQSALVTPELAEELRGALERFAREAGFGGDRPVGVYFKPGVVGHHKVGRAADIYAVGGISLDTWRRRWEEQLDRARNKEGQVERKAILDRERNCNLGWRLYKALQCYGKWSQPYGYPIQLFGPWTRTEGPWTFISGGLLRAHRDHIHVAK